MTKEGEVVLCTVKRIEGTTVFLEIEGNGEGTMTFSEVSPGRIRNIREFVVPNKKIACKILRINNAHIELSLRRVTAKERDEIMEEYKKARVLSNMLRPVLKEKTSQIIEKIKEKYTISEFLEEAKKSSEIIKKFVSPLEAAELQKVFAEKTGKPKELKETIILRSSSPSGIYEIQSVLSTEKAEVSYLGSSKFEISVKAEDFKKAKHNLLDIIELMKARAKDKHLFFETKSKH